MDDHARMVDADTAPALLGPEESSGEHVGRTLHLDAGETFAFVVDLTPVQWFDPGSSDRSAPRLRLECRNEELCGPGGSVYLTADEVERLVGMLLEAQRSLLDGLPST